MVQLSLLNSKLLKISDQVYLLQFLNTALNGAMLNLMINGENVSIFQALLLAFLGLRGSTTVVNNNNNNNNKNNNNNNNNSNNNNNNNMNGRRRRRRSSCSTSSSSSSSSSWLDEAFVATFINFNKIFGDEERKWGRGNNFENYSF